MKQVVKETWNGESVKIELSYEPCSVLKGKKEREEVIINRNGCKTVTYWISVANNAKGSEKTKLISGIERSANKQSEKYSQFMDRKSVLKKELCERLERYRQQVEVGECNEIEIKPTKSDIVSAIKLQKIIGRGKKCL